MTDVTPDDLTPSQEAAYLADEKRILVLGGPGTGKTAVALLMARRILEQQADASPTRVLFLTFSRSATTELTKRAPYALSGPLSDRIDISTFHSFALGVLNAYGRYAGRSTEPITIRTREQTALGLAPPGSIGFDDLVPAAHELFKAAEWVLNAYRDRYVAVICDEFQDTNAASAALLDALAANSRLICLADSDQVIFDWTDSSITRRISDYLASGAREYDLGYDSRRDPSNVIPRAAAAIRDRKFEDEAIAEACRSQRLGVVRYDDDDDPFSVLIDEIGVSQSSGANEVGVFFATNRSVNDFAERLRNDGIEHEIVGLSGAAGEAQIAAAGAAKFAAGSGEWSDFLATLGVFVASCYRGRPPDLADALVHDPARLPPRLIALLDSEADELRAAAQESVEVFLARVLTLWSRLFTGRPRMLWESGINSLVGQTLAWRRHPIDREVAEIIARVAHSRRSSYLVDALPSAHARVRIMNVYQVKGREMDDVLLVHLDDDRDEWNPQGMARLRRVHYVALSRARRHAAFVLCPSPKSFYSPYGGLCGP